jgi:hypothetical protein
LACRSGRMRITTRCSTQFAGAAAPARHCTKPTRVSTDARRLCSLPHIRAPVCRRIFATMKRFIMAETPCGQIAAQQGGLTCGSPLSVLGRACAKVGACDR